MKPGEIFTNYSNYLKEVKSKYDTNEAKARAAFTNGNSFLKKVKFTPDTQYTILYPLEISLPFDPETLDEDVFNIDNPLPLIGAPTTVCNGLRKMAAENQDFANKLCEVLDCELDALKVEAETFDQEDIKLWHKLAHIDYIAAYVQHLNTNNSQFKFGRNIGAEVELDDDGNVIGTNGVGFRLFELENALISIRANDVHEEYTTGDKKDNPKSEETEAIRNLWKDRLIGNPFPCAFTRVIMFTTDNDNTVDKNEMSEWKRNKKIQTYMFYQKLNREKIVNTLEKALSSAKSDLSMDFIEAVVTVPRNEDGSKDRVNYMGITYTAANASSTIFNDEINDFGDFKKAYAKLRDDQKQWSKDTLKRSIFELRKLSDSALLSEMSNSLNAYNDAMKSSALIEQYGDILSQIDNTLSEKIALKIMDTGSDAEVRKEIIDAAPMSNETNTDDNGNLIDETSEDSLGDALADILNEGL